MTAHVHDSHDTPPRGLPPAARLGLSVLLAVVLLLILLGALAAAVMTGQSSHLSSVPYLEHLPPLP